MTQEIEVTIPVTVTVDETKFTPEFMEEFRQYFFPFEEIEDHIRHLAYLAATGYIPEWPSFIEGYGPSEKMGIKVVVGR